MPAGAAPEEAIQLFRFLGRRLRPGAGASWLALDLTMAQVKALLVIASTGPLAIGGLAQHLGIGLPAASNLVDRLVEQGHVRRREDPADRRRTLAAVTEQGESLVADLHEGTTGLLRRWVDRLQESDLEALVRGLRALSEVAAEPGVAARAAGGDA